VSIPKIWKDASEIDAAIDVVAAELRLLLAQRGIDDPLMVGIHTGGTWVAAQLHARLRLREPLGSLDISFYRDDFTRIGINPVVKPSELPTALDGRHIILVDDVLQTGRTIRAALNELFDYGRPASVLLAVLAERGGRELPIEPDVVGLRPQLEADQHIKLTGPEPLALVLERIRRRPGPSGEPA
jgi:pyrimidine operon attenuation protein/uracil phosphoribosyltransferase